MIVDLAFSPLVGSVRPVCCARRFNASLKSTFSTRIRKAKASPPVAQAPKQRHDWRAGKTKKEGVFSVWKGHRALKLAPDFWRGT